VLQGNHIESRGVGVKAIERSRSIWVGACVVWSLVLASLAYAGPQLELAAQLYDDAYAAHTASPPDTAKALALYLRVLELEPELYGPLFKAGHIYFGNKQYVRAKSLFGKAVGSARKNHPDKPEYEADAANALGACYQKEGRLEQAGKWFRAAIKKNPKLVEAHRNLINLYMAKDERAKAEAALERAQHTAPSKQYEIIKGRIKGTEGGANWSPMWFKVLIAGIAGGLVVYLALRHFKIGG
jgi:tetratricopeptide (TPR) repeat protein